jgi:hypothetical protein
VTCKPVARKQALNKPIHAYAFPWIRVSMVITCSPANRKRRQKGNPVPGVITGPPCSWGIYMSRTNGDLALQVGEVSDDTVKYDHEFYETSTQEWLLWQGPEAITHITDPSSRQKGRYKIINSQLSKINFEKKEKLVAGPRWVPDTKTDWPTDCRSEINFNFNFTIFNQFN